LCRYTTGSFFEKRILPSVNVSVATTGFNFNTNALTASIMTSKVINKKNQGGMLL
jgi:hypothetical protein